MRSRCEAFEEAIWDHVRFGTELSGDVLAHIEHCAECTRVLAQARQISGMVLEADCVPPAPDCRRAVMARISPAPRQPRMAWAYACAGLAVVSAAVSGVVFMSPYLGSGKQPVVAISVAPRHDTRVIPQLIEPEPKFNNDRSYSNSGYRQPPSQPAVNMRPKAPQPVVTVASAPKPEPCLDAYASGTPAGMALDNFRAAEPASTPPATEVASASVAKPQTSIAGIKTVDLDDAVSSQFDRASSLKADVSVSVREGDGFTMTGSVNSFATKPIDAAAVASKNPASDTHYSCKIDDSMAMASAPKPTLGLSARSNRTLALDGSKLAIAQPAVTTERPIAIAVVDWSVSTQPTTNYNYSYTDFDPQTGEVTNCSVERTGDVVNIRLEAQPVKIGPSRRGSRNHANNTNA